MDVEPVRYYVASEAAAKARPIVRAGLNFLLILSALLSAVTGAFAGAREQEPRTHQAAAALESAVAVTVESAVSAVPAASPILAAALPARAETTALAAFPIALAAPLDGVRLLE
jgi:hypothetical protein